MQTLKQVTNEIEKQIHKATGATVEATCRGESEWTISGNPADVNSAVDYLTAWGIMKETDRSLMSADTDPDMAALGMPDELYVYLTA